MPDNKLTDNEIIKALKRLKSTKDFLREKYQEQIKNCPYPELKPIAKQTYEDNKKAFDIAIKAIEEFNRLQAQNKELAETVHNLAIEKDALFDKAEELKVEVERLKEEKSKLENKIDEIYPLVMQLPKAMQQTKAEAYKEFARRLKCGVPQETGVIRCSDIDNLVKEIVGEDK